MLALNPIALLTTAVIILGLLVLALFYLYYRQRKENQRLKYSLGEIKGDVEQLITIVNNNFFKFKAARAAIASLRRQGENKQDPAVIVELLEDAYDDGDGICKEKIAFWVKEINSLIAQGHIEPTESLIEEIHKLEEAIEITDQPVGRKDHRKKIPRENVG